jgi:hypothetical protein
MFGGQNIKIVRRLGVPLISGVWKILTDSEDWKVRRKYLWLLLLVPILSMGYGTHSHLMKWLKNEKLVRLVYALLLYVPFGIISFNILGLLALVGAFQIETGKGWNIYRNYDFLLDDFFRASALAFNWWLI